MKTVWKFNLPTTDYAKVPMPIGAKILHVASQSGGLKLWALVDTEQKEQGERHIRVAGTGHGVYDVDTEMFIGTVLTHDAALVWHVFDCGYAPCP